MPRLARVAEAAALAIGAAVPLFLILPLSAAAAGRSALPRFAIPPIPVSAVPPEPTPATLVTGWSFDVEYLIPIALLAWGYWIAYRKVNREHPTNPVPRKRLRYWLSGLGVLVIAIESLSCSKSSEETRSGVGRVTTWSLTSPKKFSIDWSCPSTSFTDRSMSLKAAMRRLRISTFAF